MPEQGKLLTEENYKRAKKKVMRIALIILGFGILVGGGLIAAGFININATNHENEQVAEQLRQEAAEKNAQIEQKKQDSAKAKAEAQSQTQADANSIQAQINELESEISTAEAELQQIFQEDKSFSDRYNTKNAEIQQKRQQLDTLKKQSQSSSLNTMGSNLGLDEIQSEIDNTGFDMQKISDAELNIKIAQSQKDTFGYQVMIMVGIFILVASCMTSLAVYIFGKRREIAAFTTQQTMPVAQEAIGKMAPTIGNAAGEVAKGIKKGLNEADRESGAIDDNNNPPSPSPDQQ